MPALVLAKRQQKLWRCSRAVCPRSLRVQVQWPPKTPHLNWTPSPTASPSSSLVPSPHVPCDYVILESSDFTLICTPWHICSLFFFVFVRLPAFLLPYLPNYLTSVAGERKKSPLSQLPVHSSCSPNKLSLISSSESFLLSLALLFVYCEAIISLSSVFTD